MSVGLSIVLWILFSVTGGIKVFGVAQSVRVRDHLGLSPRLWRVVGLLEAAGGLGLLIGIVLPILGVAAAIGLTGLMVGAIISRVRVRDPLATISLDVVVLALVVALLALRIAG